MIYYLGSFPPPYGGVTVKNELLYSELAQKFGNDIRKLDTQKAKKNPFQLIVQGLVLLANRKHPIIVATAGTQRRNISVLLKRFNRSVLRKSTLLVMGGHFAARVRDDDAYVEALKMYRRIYVETEGMKQELMALNLCNVAIYPNCRQRPCVDIMPKMAATEKKLRCVFFSLISPDKGVDVILEAAREMPSAQFDFFGVIEPSYKARFLKDIQNYSNVEYKGVFQVKGDNVYSKLNEYDVLLLPTFCPNEGVPGVLVEAKIAAVPAIVSNVCYNAEIVEDNVSGIVLRENTADYLVHAISKLEADRRLLQSLKEGAYTSAEYYYIDHHLDEIIKSLKNA